MATASRWISTGDRTQRVDIQTRGEVGGVVVWTTRATRAAKVEMFTGREQLEAAQLLAERAGRITFACDAVTRAIEPTDRLMLGTRIFEVEVVVDVQEAHRQIEVTVVEQVH